MVSFKDPKDPKAKWRAELERRGMIAVQKKMDQAGVGRGSLVPGFECGDIERSFVEDWVAEKELAQAKEQGATLFWARIAGWAALIAVVLAAVALWLQFRAL